MKSSKEYSRVANYQTCATQKEKRNKARNLQCHDQINPEEPIFIGERLCDSQNKTNSRLHNRNSRRKGIKTENCTKGHDQTYPSLHRKPKTEMESSRTRRKEGNAINKFIITSRKWQDTDYPKCKKRNKAINLHRALRPDKSQRNRSL